METRKKKENPSEEKWQPAVALLRQRCFPRTSHAKQKIRFLGVGLAVLLHYRTARTAPAWLHDFRLNTIASVNTIREKTTVSRLLIFRGLVYHFFGQHFSSVSIDTICTLSR